MTRRYVDALTRHQEREVFMAGLFHITGFDQRPHIVKKHSSSASTYTLRRKLSLLVNSVTSFSNAPLVSIFYIGLTISCLAALHIMARPGQHSNAVFWRKKPLFQALPVFSRYSMTSCRFCTPLNSLIDSR